MSTSTGADAVAEVSAEIALRDAALDLRVAFDYQNGPRWFMDVARWLDHNADEAAKGWRHAGWDAAVRTARGILAEPWSA